MDLLTRFFGWLYDGVYHRNDPAAFLMFLLPLIVSCFCTSILVRMLIWCVFEILFVAFLVRRFNLEERKKKHYEIPRW